MSVVTGKCKWARLMEPSKEDGTFKPKYSIDLYELSDEHRKQLLEEGIEPKTDKNGEEFFRFWTSGKRKDGTLNPPVRIVDMKKQRMDEEPGNGSVVNIQYTPTDWTFLKKKGVFGALQAVQVKRLVSKIADEFGAEEPESVMEDDDDVPF